MSDGQRVSEMMKKKFDDKLKAKQHLVCYLFNDQTERSTEQLKVLHKRFSESNIHIATSDCETYRECIVTSESDWDVRQRISLLAQGFDAGWHACEWKE